MYTDQVLKQVKTFGALQYDIEKIVTILQPENPAQYYADFADTESVLYAMWKAGFNAGQFNLDGQQFEIAKAEALKTKAEAEIAQHKLKSLNQYANIKEELFGL